MNGAGRSMANKYTFSQVTEIISNTCRKLYGRRGIDEAIRMLDELMSNLETEGCGLYIRASKDCCKFEVYYSSRSSQPQQEQR